MEFCIFVEPQLGLSWEQLLTAARATERLGFDGFFRSDHLTWTDRTLRGAGVTTDAWTTLAGLAVATERIRLGTLVSPVTFREPGVLAVQVANVDAMSSGRAELGLGAGWNAVEHEAYGIPYPEKRFGRLAEALEIATGLWATEPGDAFSFAGEHYRLDRAPGAQRPTGPTGIPLIVGGVGAPRGAALAARFATEFNTWVADDAELTARFARVDAAATAIGRDPGSLRRSFAANVTIGATEAAADARARAQGVDPAEQRRTALHGTPAQIADRIAELASFRPARIYLQLLDPTELSQLDLLAEATLAAA
ncbi:TIGR03560 family F420-dependent LLM class oxidoreductase [Pseudolysinimonas sp.]|uniref:TIGR03560 family F420-dependent LLM class oxidoreductase n=1 Tax=Pseudolysinimonas sp. TaxID=2680009 RepID=UPI003F802AEC